MKRIYLAFAFLIGMAAPALADMDLYTSSNVVVNQSNTRLHTGRGVLKRVIVGQVGQGSIIDLWDGASTSVFLRKIGSVDTSSGGIRVSDFDVYIASGIVFTTAGTAAANLILVYKKGQ